MIELGNNPATYILAGIVLALFAALIWVLVDTHRSNKRLWRSLEEPTEPELIETEVRVISKRCGTKVYGSKSPQCRKEFYITFLTEDGEETEYPVEEEIYLSIHENETGTLATANGHFYGFCAE